jgi:type 1 glutamine amidotransferase
MNNKWTLSRLTVAFCAILILSWSCKNNSKSPVNLLIISGKNNHEWSKTTPLLERIYNKTLLFKVDITEKPDTLNFDILKRYDVVVSNWNTWPDNNIRMSPEWESDFLKFVKEGGGAVFIHAGASSFYNWEEYHRIGIGRWGKETSHGKPQKGKVFGLDQDHPVTRGIKDFYIVDELWQKTDIHPDANCLGSLTWSDENDGSQRTEKAVFASQTGKGKSFYTILGHDERALLNTGLQTLLLRGTIWASGKEIETEIPDELRMINDESEKSLNWDRSDTTISLRKGKDVIWQYNFNNRYGKQYFHPVKAGNSTLTCVSPPDHPWHMGLWFSWKFINGVNYWEYLDQYKSDKTGFRSAGSTSIKKMKSFTNQDFSADLDIDIIYHPSDGEAVMSEKCLLHVSPPSPDGSYFIDFDHTFSPVSGDVILDRTPISGEPEGQSWGGYSGLSIRFSQDYTSPVVIAPDTSNNCRKNGWVYMGFISLTGEKAGVCLLQDPAYTTSLTRWYIINDPSKPFYYYSPAAIFDGRIILKKEQQLHLRYRVWVIPGETRKEELQTKYASYLNNKM